MDADPDRPAGAGASVHAVPSGRILQPHAFAEPPAVASASQAAASSSRTAPASVSGGPARRTEPRRARARIAGALGLAAGLLLSGVTRPQPPGTVAAAQEGRFDPRRIAVLYFDDHSPDEELRYLASGLTESLIHELSQVEALEVISRNGVKPYRDRAVPLDSLVQALRVGSVVEGSLQQSGDSIYVTVQLIDATTQAHLDSRVVARPMGGVVALQRAVSEEVAAALRRRLGAEVRLREARAETHSAQALALLLRAEQVRDDGARIAQERDPRDAAAATALLLRADSLLALAQQADPRWARPVLLRGRVALQLTDRLSGQGDRLAAGAEASAGRVLARDPRDAEALELRGTARFWRVVQGTVKGEEALAAAERDLRAAVAAEPGLASAWSRLSQVLRYRGSFAESDLAARRALAEDAYLDGAADILHRLYASALAMGDHAAARERCDHGHARFPGDWRLLECRLTLLRDDPAERPDPARAWSLVAQLERLDPPERARAAGRAYSPVYRRVVAASISARAGDTERARAVLARARREVEGNEELRLALAFDEAYVRLLLGERAEARRLLDELVAARPALRGYVERDPLFRALFTPAAPPRAPAG
jgi:TolB-like protein